MSSWMKNNDPIDRLKEQVQSEGAKEAMEIADEVSDLILFHARVKKNGMLMMEPRKEDSRH